MDFIARILVYRG